MSSSQSNFVHLHTHTHYSTLDGASKIPDLVSEVKAQGQPAVAITDHGNMHGAYEMWRTAVDAGVKPIIGIEAYVTPETARQDKTRVRWGTEEQRSDDVSGGGFITHMMSWPVRSSSPIARTWHRAFRRPWSAGCREPSTLTGCVHR